MKPILVGGGAVGVLTGALYLAASILTGEKDVPKYAIVAHASRAAYPNAVIALKDPKTEALFYVESNGRILVAFDKGGAVVWSVDVVAEVKPQPGQGAPVIRHLRIEGDALWVTCGKSDTAKVNMKTGKTESVGRD
jgi:hypothetical protein